MVGGLEASDHGRQTTDFMSVVVDFPPNSEGIAAKEPTDFTSVEHQFHPTSPKVKLHQREVNGFKRRRDQLIRLN
jgi:hypothetical protein